LVQYWSNVVRYRSNIGPILANANIGPTLANVSLQYWSNIVANIGPTLGRNIGPISVLLGISSYCQPYNFFLIGDWGRHWPPDCSGVNASLTLGGRPSPSLSPPLLSLLSLPLPSPPHLTPSPSLPTSPLRSRIP